MIGLPTSPSPSGADVALLDFGSFLTPGLGGPVQRVSRLGNRFRIAVSMPPMRAGKTGRQWIARLIRGKTEGARIALPLLDFDPGTPGTVLVNGAGQSGSSLIVDGATPNYVFREGQFFSIYSASKHHLHMVETETVANASGQATLPITPMLRRQPANNDPCHFGKPMIEGFILGEEFMWSLAIGNFVGLQFEIVESE